MIVVIAPMQVEADALCRRMNNITQSQLGICPLTVGSLAGHNVAVIRCGVGLAAAAAATAAAIERLKPEFVVNIGIAGGIGIAPLTDVIAMRVVQADMDTSPLGDPIGYLSDLNVIFLAADADLSGALLAAAGGGAVEGVLASQDRFVASDEEMKRLRTMFGADCCDMEGAAVAHACAMWRTPFAILRTVSDNGDGADFAKFALAAAEHAAQVFEKFLTGLSHAEV